jgi:hypothetical protein
MRMFRVALRIVALALLGAACGSGGQHEWTSAAFCSWPDAANTSDATTSVGCEPTPTFRVCEVPSGATPNADGSYTPPATCTDPCAPGGYALRCTGSIVDGVLTSMPAPDPSLRCDVLPIPSPRGQAVYCCPCVRRG